MSVRMRNVTHVTDTHITYITGGERVTLLSERRGAGRSLPQKVVQPAPWGVHPFYPDVDRSPFLLEGGAQQLGNLVRQVERSAIPEVQARPHAGEYAR